MWRLGEHLIESPGRASVKGSGERLIESPGESSVRRLEERLIESPGEADMPGKRGYWCPNKMFPPDTAAFSSSFKDNLTLYELTKGNSRGHVAKSDR